MIFDLGGVIVDFNEGMYVRYMSKRLGIDYEKMHRTITGNLRKYELGKTTFDAFRTKCLRSMGLNSRTDLEWNESFMKLAKTDAKVESLVRKLRKNYKTALVTNISRSRYIMAYRYKFDPNIFDKRFTSFGTGIAKPDPRIYRMVTERMGSDPKESVFIDNLKENVDGAKSIGINGVVFKGYNKLIDDLKEMGVL